MVTLLIVVAILLLAGILLAYWSFFPKEGIYYLEYYLESPHRQIKKTGEDDDNDGWEFVMKPFYSVRQFDFEFKQIVTPEKAQKQKYNVLYKINENEVIVLRSEKVWGYLEREIHPIMVGFDTMEEDKGSVDAFLVFNAIFKPVNAVVMKKKSKNWLTLAEDKIREFFSTYGRTNPYQKLRELSFESLVQNAEHTELAKSITDEASFVSKFNELYFRELGFEIISISILHVMYGPKSKEIFDLQEKRKKLNEIEQNTDKETAIVKKKADTDNSVKQQQEKRWTETLRARTAIKISAIKATQTAMIESNKALSGNLKTLVLGNETPSKEIVNFIVASEAVDSSKDPEKDYRAEITKALEEGGADGK